MEFGAFVELEPGVEGLIHISELSHKRVWRASDVVHEGDEVEVLVLSVNTDAQRISLSMKALSKPEPTQKEKEEAQAREAAPAARVEEEAASRPASPGWFRKGRRRRAVRAELVAAPRTRRAFRVYFYWIASNRGDFRYGGAATGLPSSAALGGTGYASVSAGRRAPLTMATPRGSAGVASATRLPGARNRGCETHYSSGSCACSRAGLFRRGDDDAIACLDSGGRRAVGVGLRNHGARRRKESWRRSAPRDPRRTPVVEVFHRWKASVVYLTGPMASGPQPAADEFFQIPFRREMISIGSGFVVHETGYVVTNAHAVERVIAHHVTLIDGRTYPAEVVGIARECDLALLKVESGRPAAPGAVGQERRFPPRRDDRRHQQSERTAAHLHHGDHQRRRPNFAARRPARNHPPRPDSNGREHQPGEFRRAVVQRPRGSRRADHGDAEGRAEHRLRHLRGHRPPNAAGNARRRAATRASTPASACSTSRRSRASFRTWSRIPPPSPPASMRATSSRSLMGERSSVVANSTCRWSATKGAIRCKSSCSAGTRSVEATLVLDPRTKPNGEAILRQRFGLAAEPLSEEKAYATRLRVHRGVVITGVRPGCTAG